MSRKERRRKLGAVLALGALYLMMPSTLSAAQAPTSPTASSSAVAEAGQIAARAERLATAKKFAEAALLFGQAAEKSGDWALWDRAGWCFLDAGQPEPSRAAFESARKAAPPATPLSGGLLIAEYLLGHEAETLALLKQFAPTEELATATATVKAGIASGTGAPARNYGLGYLHARVLGNSPRGVAPLEAVAKAEPTRADAWLLLADLNLALNDEARYLAAAATYLKLAPETVNAFRLRAEHYYAQGKYNESQDEYEEGIEKHPLAAGLYYGLARLHERLNEVKEAEATYTKLATLATEQKQPELANQARARLATSQIRRRRYVDAARYYEEAVKAPDAPLTTWQTFSSLLVLNRRWDDAAQALDTLAARQAKEPGTAPAEVLNTRLRSVLCRLTVPKSTVQPPPPGFDALKAALAKALTDASGRTASVAEAAAFVAWMEGKSAPPSRLAYVPTDERWAAFTWRREPEEGEFETRGSVSPAASSWRSLLMEVRKAHPESWAAGYALARAAADLGYTEDALSLLEGVSKARPDWWAPFFARGQYYARERDKERGIPVLQETLRLAPECRQARTYLTLLTSLREKPQPAMDIDLDEEQ